MRLRSVFVFLWSLLALLSGAFGAPPRSTLVNLSMRAAAGTGDATLIGGFVISGTQPRPILLRAAGPALRPALGGLALADPRLTLFRGGTTLTENDDWAPEIASVLTGLGAGGFTPGSRDSALWHALAPGLYSMHALSAGTGTGEVVLELYDGQPLPGSPASDSAIVNLSVRAVASDATPAIAGFGIAGTQPKRLLLRAVGPALAGVLATHLADPVLTLYAGQSPIGTNDNWSDFLDQPALVSTAQALGAGAFAAGSGDAALLVTLAPGNYTAHIRPAPGSRSGVVVFEIFDADSLVPEEPVIVVPPAEPPPVQPPVIEPPVIEPPAFPVVRLQVEQRTTQEGAANPGRVSILPESALAAPLEVTLAWGGAAQAGVDYVALAPTVTLPAGSGGATLAVVALADERYEATETVEVRLVGGTGYVVADVAPAALLITDHTPETGTGFSAEYFANKTLTGTPVVTRIDPAIDFNWGNASPAEGLPVDNFSARWRGSLLVPSTGDYTFIVRVDNGVRLWINEALALDTWAANIYTEVMLKVPLVGGTRCALRMEFFESGGSSRAHLHWLPPGTTRAPIPATAVVPGAASLPPVIVPPAVPVAGLVGLPFAYRFTTPGHAGVTIRGVELPPGLTLDAATGLLAGTPTTAGEFATIVTVTSAAGSGSAALHLRILDTGAALAREEWIGPIAPLGVEGTPAGTPTASGVVEGALDAANPSSAVRFVRWRGYLTAPTTGVYRFFLSGDAGAELWLADSAEPGDRVQRIVLPVASGVRAWTEQTAQAAAPIALTAGQRYYLEVRATLPAGGGHLALGWLPAGAPTSAAPQLVPAPVFSPFAGTAAQATDEEIYLALLRPVGGVMSLGSGVAVLEIDPVTQRAQVAIRTSGLSSPITNTQVTLGDEVAAVAVSVADVPAMRMDGYAWTLRAIGELSAADLLAGLREGRWSVVVHTADHPLGELRAGLGRATGTSQFVPPAAAPVLPAGEPTPRDAARLLMQATFGATREDLARVGQLGVAGWIEEQQALPASYHLPYLTAVMDAGGTPAVRHRIEAWWEHSINAPDQLRQRVAYALSQIFVISDRDSLVYDAVRGTGTYYDLLVRHAFGDFRTLLEDVTLNPTMGRYLSMLRNRKADPLANIYPDENYAREVMQLFTIGLHKLHPDGTLVLDSTGLPIPTYGQDEIMGLARVFTGWSYASDLEAPNFLYDAADTLRPMQLFPAQHEPGEKRLIEGVVLPAGGDGHSDLDTALDLLAGHANTGPFIARRLIQHLVTSNPSPGYVYRVAQAFADDGTGRRGQLGAVIRAILTDYEARSLEAAAAPTFGRLREPLVRGVASWRSFRARASTGDYRFWNPEATFDQAPLRARTVFNFFQPDHVHSGGLAVRGLVAPEFQITTEDFVAIVANWFDTKVYTEANPAAPERVLLDLAYAESLAADPDALLDHLDLLLTAGALSADRREIIRPALVRVTNLSARTKLAVHLLLTAPDYSVQR